jgi:hypothetical protein
MAQSDSRGRFGPSSPIAWALLSQTIWLPLLAIDLHDRWQANVNEARDIAAVAANVRPPATPLSTANTATQAVTPSPGSSRTGLMLGPSAPMTSGSIDRQESGTRSLATRLAEPATEHIDAAQKGLSSSEGIQPLGLGSPRPSPSTLLSSGFRRSELLGGAITLADLQQPAAPSLALAERARWASSSDPLAPLPAVWREPMRQALQALPATQGGTSRIQSARVIHIPSNRVRQSTTVPLAIQGDGSVDILSRADDPAVVEEIRHWSRKQTPGGGNGLRAALVNLEPIPAAPDTLVPPRTSAAPAPIAANRASLPQAQPAQPPQASEASAPIPTPAPAAMVANERPAPSPAPAPAPAPEPAAVAAPAPDAAAAPAALPSP